MAFPAQSPEMALPPSDTPGVFLKVILLLYLKCVTLLNSWTRWRCEPATMLKLGVFHICANFVYCGKMTTSLTRKWNIQKYFFLRITKTKGRFGQVKDVWKLSQNIYI